MQLAYALFGLALKFLGGRGKVGILIAEQLVRDLAGEQHAYVGVLVYPAAEQIHTHACANGGYIICAEDADDRLERIEYLLTCHNDLGVLGTDIFRDLTGVAEVDSVDVHTDRKGAYGLLRALGGDRADER